MVAAASDRGQVRSGNEDACGFNVEGGIFVVCDGMGGAAAGEVASQLAVDALIGHICGVDRAGTCECRDDKGPELLREAIVEANEVVYLRAKREPGLHGMGTTLVALLTDGDRAWVAHAGDSRCYRLRRGALEQLTLDHSLVDEQVRLGQLTREEAERSPLRSVITRAVGSQNQLEPDISNISMESGDVLLMCSDGLTREVSDDKICQALGMDQKPEEICATLIRMANEAGGHDNITCLLVRVE